ncbi:hypothetical protein EAH79_10505 [Sphingomonas koreensis]|nr:hypothetical protein EAH79_10505 [Sphingomonas koreensis]
MTNQAGAAAPDVTSVITTTHLIVIVILAIAALLVIWWGGRRRRERLDATRDAEDRRTHIDEVTDAPVELKTTGEAANEPAPPPRVEAPPTTPAPPPLVDAPAPTPAPHDGARLPLTMLKGLGPKVAARLAELGVHHVDQLAALSPAEAGALDAQLGTFSGRMARDRWIEQAQLLAAGDTAGFEAQFGKLG